MTFLSLNDDILKKFGKYSIFTGILLMLVGITGVVIPEMMSLETAVFIASFMLIGGLSGQYIP
ncbi:MAG: hypothetical protein ACWA5R_11825 [bacterium]